MVLRTQGGSGGRAGAQHSQSLEAWLTHIPGLKVVMPATAADAAGLLRSAIADPNPVVFVENKSLYFRRETMPDPAEPVAMGRAKVLRRGRDVTIVALSRLVGEAMTAAERLSAEGIDAEVIDPRSLVPLDLETIADSVRRTGRAVVAHEAVRTGGFGAELAAELQAAAFDYLDAPVQRVGAPFMPVPLSPSLEDGYRPQSDDIHAAATHAVRWAEVEEPVPVSSGGAGMTRRPSGGLGFGRGRRIGAGRLIGIGRGPAGQCDQRGAGHAVQHLAVLDHDLEVGQRQPGVLAGQALGPRALTTLDRVDQARVVAVGDDQDVPGRRQLGLSEDECARPREGQRHDALERAHQQRAAGHLEQPRVKRLVEDADSARRTRSRPGAPAS